MNWTELFGFIGGFLTTIGMVPQVWRLFRLKRSYEISMTFGLSFTIGIFFWLVYGIMYGLFSVILWNSIALILGCGLIYAKVKWGKR